MKAASTLPLREFGFLLRLTQQLTNPATPETPPLPSLSEKDNGFLPRVEFTDVCFFSPLSPFVVETRVEEGGDRRVENAVYYF